MSTVTPDSRNPIDFHQVNVALLAMAERPTEFYDAADIPATYGTMRPGFAARLARQAAASVVSNCVTVIWSHAVAKLHSVEPDFPLYPNSVQRFVEETRLSFLSYVSIFYSMCKRPFNGTVTQQKLHLIVDMRHALQHDKPEPDAEYSTARVNTLLKWFNRLEPFVGREGLLWQPKVSGASNTSHVSLHEPIIFKFMKYPVARWVADTTYEVLNEWQAMLTTYPGKKRQTDVAQYVARIDERWRRGDKLLDRMWSCGD